MAVFSIIRSILGNPIFGGVVLVAAIGLGITTLNYRVRTMNLRGDVISKQNEIEQLKGSVDLLEVGIQRCEARSYGLKKQNEQLAETLDKSRERYKKYQNLLNKAQSVEKDQVDAKVVDDETSREAMRILNSD